MQRSLTKGPITSSILLVYLGLDGILWVLRVCLCGSAYGHLHRPGRGGDHCSRCALSAHRGRMLHWHRHPVSAVRLLPRRQLAADVGHSHHCIAGQPCSAGIFAVGNAAGRYRHLAQRAHWLGAGGYHRHWVLPEKEALKSK